MRHDTLTFNHTKDQFDSRVAIHGSMSAYRLITSTSPTTQEQLVRIAASVRDDQIHSFDPWIFRSMNDEIARLRTEAEHLFYSEKTIENRIVGRHAIALANLVHGEFDKDGFEIELREPLHEINVIPIFWQNHANIRGKNVSVATIADKLL